MWQTQIVSMSTKIIQFINTNNTDSEWCHQEVFCELVANWADFLLGGCLLSPSWVA